MTTAVSNDESETKPEPRAVLEAEAEIAKRKLLRTLDKLDEKRRHAVATVSHVRHDLLVGGILAGVLLGVVLGEIRLRSANRRKKDALAPYRARYLAVRRAWSNPDRVADEHPKGAAASLVQTIAVKAVTAAVSILLPRIAKFLIDKAQQAQAAQASRPGSKRSRSSLPPAVLAAGRSPPRKSGTDVRRT